MLRRLIVLSALILLAGFVASFLAGQGGESRIDWLGYRIEVRTSLLVAALVSLALLILLLDRLLSYLVMLPTRLTRGILLRRREEGEHAVALGLVAAAVGDSGEAAKQARRARRLTGPTTLTGLLDAQVATMKGNTDAAGRFFDGLTGNRATAWLGHAGKMRLRTEAGDDGAALEAGRAAFASRRNEPGLARALFVLEARGGNWLEAVDALKVVLRNARKGAGREEAETAMAVLYHQLAEESAANGEPGEALKHLEKALTHDPGLVPAALKAAGTLLGKGATRKATALLEKSFLDSPHPDVAALLTGHWSGSEAANLARLMRLADKGGNRPEAVGTCASIAVRLQLWGEAKRLVERIPEEERDAQIWSILAEVGRNPPAGRRGNWPVAEECLARAAAAPRSAGWTCGRCGHLSDEWKAHCIQCGGFAALEWRR